MKLEVVTPKGLALDVEATSITAPGTEGEFTVLPGHQPGLIMLGGGAVTYEGARSGSVWVRGGVAEVRPDGVLVLADEARGAGDLKRSEAEALLTAIGAPVDAWLDDEALAQQARDRRFAEAVLKGASH